MRKKYITVMLVSLLFSLVFIGVGENESEYRKAAELFKTSWLDGLRAIVAGLVFGAILNLKAVESYIGNLPMGSLLYSSSLFFVALIPILIGVFGAALVFFRFGEFGLLGPPLHASCVGLSFLTIFYVLRWSSEKSI